MDLRIPEELREIQQAVAEWVTKRVIPVEQEIEETDEVPERILTEAARMGLFGIRIPEEYGGLGLGVLGQSLIYEALGRTSHGLCTIIGAHTGIGSTGLVEMGTEEQKRRYLPGMATGERLACFALTEPQAGSDAAQLLTTAERRGDRYILNGQKCFISNAPQADLFTVFAITDKAKGAKGISAFLVERSFSGFAVGKPERKMGLRGSHTAELFFTEPPGDDPESIIRGLGASLVAAGIVDDRYVEGALERERMSSTAFSDTLAMPHAMGLSATRTAIALALCPTPVAWGDARVSVVALIAFSPEGRARFQPLFDQFVDVFASRREVGELVRAGDDFASFIGELAQLIERR